MPARPRSRRIPQVRTRLDLRTPPTVRHVLELAAREAGESLAVFLLHSALARARVHVFDKDLLDAADHEMRHVRAQSHQVL